MDGASGALRVMSSICSNPASGRVEAGVEREFFLVLQRVRACRSFAVEDEVPAMGRDGAGDQDEQVVGKQIGPECLLASSWRSRPQPVWVWNGIGIDNEDIPGVIHFCRCDDVGPDV